MERVAEHSLMKLISRLSMISLIPLALFLGGRLLSQLDNNSTAIDATSKTLAVTVHVLNDMVKRVEGLEERERNASRTPNR